MSLGQPTVRLSDANRCTKYGRKKGWIPWDNWLTEECNLPCVGEEVKIQPAVQSDSAYAAFWMSIKLKLRQYNMKCLIDPALFNRIIRCLSSVVEHSIR